MQAVSGMAIALFFDRVARVGRRYSAVLVHLQIAGGIAKQYCSYTRGKIWAGEDDQWFRDRRRLGYGQDISLRDVASKTSGSHSIIHDARYSLRAGCRSVSLSFFRRLPTSPREAFTLYMLYSRHLQH